MAHGTDVADATAKPRKSGLARARRNEALLLVTPSLIPVVVLSVVPLLIGIGTAFTNATLRRRQDIEFVGFDQFIKLAGQTDFWQSFGIGMIWSVSVTVLQVALGLSLALLLNADLRLKNLTRLLALIPWAMPPVVIAIMWQMIYAARNGPLNWLIGSLGGPEQINWLGSFTLALPAVILVGVWVGMPQNTITLLAGLQQVPQELMEAAAVDGAGALRRFWHVVLPSLTPVMVAIGSLSFIWNFNSFGIVYVMTEGGPGGKTLLPMLYTYLEAFKNRDTGLASAMGAVIVVFLIVVLLVFLRKQFKGDTA